MLIVICCSISLPVTNSHIDDKILKNLKPVDKVKNPILNAIMKAKSKWNSMPTIYVDGSTYKIKLLKSEKTGLVYRVSLLQIAIGNYDIQNGNEKFQIINTRRVDITFKESG